MAAARDTPRPDLHSRGLKFNECTGTQPGLRPPPPANSPGEGAPHRYSWHNRPPRLPSFPNRHLRIPLPDRRHFRTPMD